jgi:hypothetical protein
VGAFHSFARGKEVVNWRGKPRRKEQKHESEEEQAGTES